MSRAVESDDDDDMKQVLFQNSNCVLSGKWYNQVLQFGQIMQYHVGLANL